MALTKIPSSLLDTSGGFDLQGNITLGDNEQIQLGTSGDLAIYHNGTDSWIQEAGTGNLNIKSNGTFINFLDGSNNLMAYMVPGGAVGLYHNTSKKFETSSTGATVTGNLAVTGDLDITGDINSYNVTDLDVTDKTITLGAGQTEANSGGSGIIIDGSSASILWDETNDVFDINKGLTTLGNVGIGTDNPNRELELSAANPRFRITDTDGGYSEISGNSGHLSFSADTGNSRAGTRITFDIDGAEKVRIDSSGNIGFGTSSPNNYSGYTTLTFNNATYGGAIEFENNGTRVGTIFSDQTSTILKTVANVPLLFGTNDAEKMRINSSGNLGLGTTNPSAKCHLYTSTSGAINLGIQNSQRYWKIETVSEKLSIADVSAGGLERMTFDTSGRVGIGTTSPDVYGIHASNSSNSVYFKSVSGSIQTLYGGATALGYGLLGTTTNHPLAIYTNNSEKVRIDTSGNVKINNTRTTAVPLHVVGGTASGTMYDVAVFAGGQNSTSGSGAKIYLTGCENDPIARGTIIEGQMIDNGNSHALIFHTSGNSQPPAERMRINSSGNVGIGTASPLSNNKLHVNGNVHIGNGEDYSSYAKLAVYDSVYQGDVGLLIKNDRYNDSVATASLIFEHRTHGGQGHAAKIVCRRQGNYNETAGSKDAALDFYTAEGGSLARHMVLTRSGQFGVGNNASFDAYAHHVIQSDTTQKVLDLKQNNATGRVLGLQYIPNGPDDTTDYYMVCSDSNTNDMFIYSNGNVANKNNSYGSSSDIKIKQNISDANSQWNDIKALQFKNYKLKTDVARYGEDNADTLLGLIAQDVETAGMNGLVYESKDQDSDGNDLGTVTKGVKYSVLYLKAVKALQEAIVKIEDLEARIAELEG